MKYLSFALLVISAAALYVSGHKDVSYWLGIAAAALLIFSSDDK